jgi:superfamily I DNA and/or RNA helicase
MSAGIQGLVAPVYGPAYRPHPSVAAHRLRDLPGVRPGPLTDAAVVFVDTAGSGEDEAVDPVSRSRFRDEEVERLGAAVDELVAHGVPVGAIGVIAAYRAQVLRLRARLPAGVEVSTVDAFQGREAEAVLVSFVRSNPDGALGFVADLRRLTVAITRARRLLWMVGDSATLGQHPRFAEVFEAVAAAGGWRSIWD